MYKVSISGHDSRATANKHCVVMISLGQKYHEEEIFADTLKKIISLFPNVSIFVADTLQRHNHSIKATHLTNDALMNYYHKLGDDWINRNKTALQQCNIEENKIHRWSEWLNDRNFIFALKHVEELYAQSSIFKNCVDQTLNYQLQKASVRESGSSIDKKSYQDYLFEECAVLKLWETSNFDYLAYPAKLNPAMQFILENIYTSTDSLVPLYIRYKKIIPNEIQISTHDTKREIYYKLHSDTLLNQINLVIKNKQLSKQEKMSLISSVINKCEEFRNKVIC